MKIVELVRYLVDNKLSADQHILLELKAENEAGLLTLYKKQTQELRGYFLTQVELEKLLELGLLEVKDKKYVVTDKYRNTMDFDSLKCAEEFWVAYPPTGLLSNGKTIPLLGIDKKQFDLLYDKHVKNMKEHQRMMYALQIGEQIRYSFPKISNFILQNHVDILLNNIDDVTPSKTSTEYDF